MNDASGAVTPGLRATIHLLPSLRLPAIRETRADEPHTTSTDAAMCLEITAQSIAVKVNPTSESMLLYLPTVTRTGWFALIKPGISVSSELPAYLGHAAP